MEKGCGMELDEFHVFHCSLGTVDHGNAVSRGYQWVGGMAVNGFATARCHDGDFGKEGIHLARRFVQHVGTVALDAGGMAGNDDSLVMLGNDFHSIVVGQYGDVGWEPIVQSERMKAVTNGVLSAKAMLEKFNTERSSA